MRIAWLGPAPCEETGPCYTTTQLVPELVKAGIEVDCFIAAPASSIPPRLTGIDGLSFFCLPPRWQWNRWYSRTPLMKFVSGQAARARAHVRLAALVAERHADRPYDLLYQYSQIELFGVRRLRRRLPPIVIHPTVHIGGELRWHRREARLARSCEPRAWHLAVRSMLTARALVQKRDIRLARMVVALSRRFGDHLCRDYGVPPDAIRVVPNPIDLARFAPRDGPPPRARLTILFVARLSVRKGVDLVVALSHRLADLAGAVEIKILGDRTLWSDYRPLLAGLNADVATYVGSVAPPQLREIYRDADGLVQPSLYEPFALTVGEALSSGLLVAASDEVGAAEDVDRRCCIVFPAGDLDAFEAATRELVARLRGERRPELGGLARAEAERLFAPATVAGQLADCLREAAARPRVSEAVGE
jgi:glycosyltransferase involved in cell wall biosynthesis